MTPSVVIDVVFSVQDLGDSFYDTAVFLDRFFWSNDPDCGEGSSLVSSLPGDQNGRPEDLCEDTQPGRGGPINTRTGNLWTAATDLTVVSPGPALVWERTYQSQRSGDPPESLGAGWQHPYATHLLTDTMVGGEPGMIIIVSPMGNRLRFADQDGQFEPAAGVYHTLEQDSAGYTLTRRDQTQHVFAAATGRLTTIRDPRGRALDLSYDSSGRRRRAYERFASQSALSGN